MRKIRASDFQQKPLRVHSILAGVLSRNLARVDILRGRGGTILPELDLGRVEEMIWVLRWQ